MSDPNEAWREAQRRRWLRPNWQLYVRADAYRFAAPGTPEAKMPGWLDPSMTRVRLKEAQEAEARRQAEAAQEEFERKVLALRHDLAKLKLEYELRRFQEKYSPNQPRVPAGNPDGGQWTSDGGVSVGSSASGSDGQVLSDESPDPIRPGAQYAQNEPRGRPIDLLEEQRLGGHAIEGHVGKSHEFLLARVRRLALDAERDGYAQGLKVGSFSSLEAANKLVSATVSRNSAQVDLMTSGKSGRQTLNASFDTPTGYEAYAPTERSQPYVRDTYDVRVIIVRDGSAAKGFRVDTAYPGNFRR